MKAMRALFSLLLYTTPVQLVIAQTQPNKSVEAASQSKRDGMISGRVISDAGRPVGGAPILVIKAGVKFRSGMQTTTADGEGNFKATGLAPGSYMISAKVPGYIVARPVSGSDYHRPGENVTINLIKGGVITGRVTDPFNEPMVGVRVAAVIVRELEGRRKYLGDPPWMIGKLTDDRGVYRLYGLEPGIYVVGASSDSTGLYYGYYDGREAMTWHPSSPRATAAEIAVRSGDEITGADIRHREERGYTISGTISGEAASGSTSEDITIMLTVGADRQLAGTTTVDGAKPFALFGVSDGEYEITALRANPRETDFASSAPRRVVVKGADVSGIELKIAPPASISGIVKIESSNSNSSGGVGKSSCDDAVQAKHRAVIGDVLFSAVPENEARPPLRSITPYYFHYTGGVMGGAPDGKGEFTLKGLAAGRYQIKADLPDDGWYISAITQPLSGSAKTLDTFRKGITVKSGEMLSGVEVVISEGAASLNGRVVAANEVSSLPSWLRVHLVPAEVSAVDFVSRYAETMIRAGGLFEFKHIAAGKYQLYARQVAEKEANDEEAPPLAWDAVERTKLRREAAAAKNEIELKPCQRAKDQVLKWRPIESDSRLRDSSGQMQ